MHGAPQVVAIPRPMVRHHMLCRRCLTTLRSRYEDVKWQNLLNEKKEGVDGCIGYSFALIDLSTLAYDGGNREKSLFFCCS